MGLLYEFFEETNTYTHLRDHSFSEAVVCVSDTDRAQGRAVRPVRKEEKNVECEQATAGR